VNWDAVAAIAELAGAIGVIVSLVYLALQIRQNTAQIDTNSSLMRAESRRHWKTHATQVNLALAQDAKLAGIFTRGLASFQSLPPDEQIQFTFLFSEMVSTLDTAFDEQAEGLAKGGSFERAVNSMGDLIKTPGGREFWRVHGRRVGSAAFRNWVESELLRDDRPD